MKTQAFVDHSAFPAQGTLTEQVEFLLQYAVLAPSTHNIQPWRFELVLDGCVISADEHYDLPENDPTGRDLHISLGCCTENLVLAAQSFGLAADVKWLDGRDRQAVRVSFIQPPSGAWHAPDTATLDAIVARFNARGLFKKRAVPQEFIELLGDLNSVYGQDVHVYPVTAPKKAEQLAALTAQGLRQAYHNAKFRSEIASWIRPNNSKKLDGLPGYALRMNLPLSMLLPVVMKRFDIGGKLGQINYVSARSAPLICVFDSTDDTPAKWKQLGRLAERVMVEANRRGMKTSIFVASVEIGDLYKQVQTIVGTKGRPQFLLVCGYISTPQGHTPRHSVQSRLIKSGVHHD